MLADFFELLGNILLSIQDLVFWKKRKERRKYEKENNLRKKTMIHPVTWIFLILFVATIFFVSIGSYVNSSSKTTKTNKRINKLEKVLIKTKNDSGKYPERLKELTRNNPTKKSIISDAWGNEFFYEQLQGGQSFELKSKGKDGVLNTKDDISMSD